MLREEDTHKPLKDTFKQWSAEVHPAYSHEAFLKVGCELIKMINKMGLPPSQDLTDEPYHNMPTGRTPRNEELTQTLSNCILDGKYGTAVTARHYERGGSSYSVWDP
jgi:hypothetical protein